MNRTAQHKEAFFDALFFGLFGASFFLSGMPGIFFSSSYAITIVLACSSLFLFFSLAYLCHQIFTLLHFDAFVREIFYGIGSIGIILFTWRMADFRLAILTKVSSQYVAWNFDDTLWVSWISLICVRLVFIVLAVLLVRTSAHRKKGIAILLILLGIWLPAMLAPGQMTLKVFFYLVFIFTGLLALFRTMEYKKQSSPIAP